MRYDAVIIGGGLSGLVCGIRLQQSGLKTVIVSSGQSALHFSSGTFSLLSSLPDGTAVDEPLAALEMLPEGHPYRKIGVSEVAGYASSVPSLFGSWGVKLHGSEQKNSWRLCASGVRKRAWLALEDTTLYESRDSRIAGRALIVNLQDFQDFYTSFIAASLEKTGTACRVVSVAPDALSEQRKNSTQMRSIQIAMALDNLNILKSFADSIKALYDGEDLIVLPQVFGYRNTDALDFLREELPAEVLFVSTMIPSVPGLRTQMTLAACYQRSGGTLLKGDTVTGAEVKDGTVTSIRTANIPSVPISAGRFILAGGRLLGKGLASAPNHFSETVFGLDLIADEGRSNWYEKEFYADQNYMSYGVKTDDSFHPYLGGRRLENLQVAGSILSGANSLREGSGAGIAVITSLAISDLISKK